MRSKAELRKYLLDLDWPKREAALAKLTFEERSSLRYDWEVWAREEQVPPTREGSTWLNCAGRGFGKTRASVEWVRYVARTCPDARIALVGASLAEARSVMVEGESGILACCHPDRAPEYEP